MVPADEALALDAVASGEGGCGEPWAGAPPTDQRGIPRPQRGASDIGAVELEPPPT